MTNTKPESPHDDIRGKVRARVTPEIVAKLAEEFSIPTDKGVLRERIVHVLTRYERGMISDSRPTKKELRKQLRNAVNSTTKLHQILSDSQSQIREDLLYQLEYDTYAEWLETVDFSTLDSPPQVLNLADTSLLVKRLKYASERLLSELEPTAALEHSDMTEPLTGIARTPLDQLITNLPNHFWTHMGQAIISVTMPSVSGSFAF